MQRSIFTLSVILLLVVMLTILLARIKLPAASEQEVEKVDRTMSLRRLDYSPEINVPVKSRTDYSINDFVQKGYSLWREGRTTRAEDIFKTALLFDPDNAETVKSIGRLAFIDGRFDDACNYFTHFLTLKPNSSEGFQNLAISLFCAKNIEASEMITNSAINKFSNENIGPFQFILACIKQERGQTELANQLIRASHHSLGVEIRKLMGSEWASGLSELNAFQEIEVQFDKSNNSNSEKN